MRLVIIADTYPPLRISGAVQMRDLVREFANQGHEPTVIVPAATLEEPWKVEQADGVTVLRVRTPPTKDVNYLQRTINELRLPYVLLRGMRRARVPLTGWDGVVWYSPTIFLGPIVKQIRRASGCRSYLILRDLFPEWAVDMGLMGRGLPYQFFKWIEAGQYAVADTIGVQCSANLPYLSAWAADKTRRLEVLENWLSPANRGPCRINLSTTPLARRKIFVYTGNMGVAQGMDVFLGMVEKMRDRQNVGFVFVGRGSEAARLANEATQKQLGNVLFFDEIEPEEIPGLLAQCDFAMLALDPRLTSHNVPGKFLTYMQAGLPVLARINPGNELERLITGEEIGLVRTGGDSNLLAEMCKKLADGVGLAPGIADRAKSLWQKRFSTQMAVRQVVGALSARLGGSTQG